LGSFWINSKRVGWRTGTNNYCFLIDDQKRTVSPLFGGSLAVLLAVHGGGRRAGSSDQVAAVVQSALLGTYQHFGNDPDRVGRSSGHGIYRNSDFPGESDKRFFLHVVWSNFRVALYRT